MRDLFLVPQQENILDKSCNTVGQQRQESKWRRVDGPAFDEVGNGHYGPLCGRYDVD
jgi:hypothetical protein